MALILLILFKLFGLCCPSSKTPPKFSSTSIRVVKVCIFVVSLVLVGAFVIGFIGNAGVSQDLNDMLSIVSSSVKQTQTLGDQVAKLLTDSGSPTAPADSAAFQAPIALLSSNIDSTSKWLQKGDNWRSWIMLGAFALPVVGVFFAFLSMLMRKGWLTWFFVVFCFLSLFVNWTSFSVHRLVSTVTKDFCTDLDVFLTDPPNYRINNLVQCLGAEPARTMRDSATNQAQALQTDVNNAYGSTKISLDFTGLRSTVNATLNAAIDDSRAKITAIKNESPAPSSQVLATLAKMEFAISVLPIVNEIQKCSLISSSLSKVQPVLCKSFVDHILYIIIAHGMIGCILIPGVIWGILGTKRFSQKGDNMVQVESKLPLVAPTPWKAPTYENQYVRPADSGPVKPSLSSKLPSKPSMESIHTYGEGKQNYEYYSDSERDGINNWTANEGSGSGSEGHQGGSGSYGGNDEEEGGNDYYYY